MKYKNYIINTFRHFKKVCTHKRWVFYYCCKVGIPFQGLVHDLSKFSPTEFWESVKYYQGTSSPIDACKKENGWSAAWMHHKGRNKHHYEYWQDNFDNGGNPIEMPMKYKKEMLCDYEDGCLPIRIPGGTLGSIEYDENKIITKINVCTDYVVKTYPDDVNEQLQKFIGQKIEMGEAK